MAQRTIRPEWPNLIPNAKLALKMPMREEQDKIQLWKETMFSATEVQSPCFM